jgi:hypothetical protein
MTPIDPAPISHSTLSAAQIEAASITIGPDGVVTGSVAVQPHAEDFYAAAHEVATKHIDACWAAFHASQEGDEEVPSPASAPFDGCQTCETREVLHAAWPLLRLAALAGYTA